MTNAIQAADWLSGRPYPSCALLRWMMNVPLRDMWRECPLVFWSGHLHHLLHVEGSWKALAEPPVSLDSYPRRRSYQVYFQVVRRNSKRASLHHIRVHGACSSLRPPSNPRHPPPRRIPPRLRGRNLFEIGASHAQRVGQKPAFRALHHVYQRGRRRQRRHRHPARAEPLQLSNPGHLGWSCKIG